MGITARIDAITQIDAAHSGVFIPAPRSVKVEITANCSYRCTFCVKSLRADTGEMDRALYSRLLREMRDAGVEEIGVFYIGESFTLPWLPEAIAEAKAVGFPYVFLTTNGSASTPARVKECMEAGLDSLKFSLNFGDSAQMAEVAQVSPRLYDRAIANIKAARRVRDEGGYKCGLYASSIAFDGEQGEKMRTLVDSIRPSVDEHYWLPLYGMSGASKEAGWMPQPRRLAFRFETSFAESSNRARLSESWTFRGSGWIESIEACAATRAEECVGWNFPTFLTAKGSASTSMSMCLPKLSA